MEKIQENEVVAVVERPEMAKKSVIGCQEIARMTPYSAACEGPIDHSVERTGNSVGFIPNECGVVLAIPWMQDGMSAFDTIVIDDLEQERAMEKPMGDPALVHGDVAGLVLNETSVSFDAAKRSAFVFRGVAIGDCALASLAYTRATTPNPN